MSTLALEARDFAHELYDLLRALDRAPGEEALAQLKGRIERMRERCRQLIESEAARDEAVAALVRSLKALARSLEELWQRLSDEGSAARACASFRSAVAPKYEALAARLRAMRVEAPTLRPSNLKRSAYHLGNGLVAAAAIELLPWPVVTLLAALFFLFAWTVEIGRRYSGAIDAFAMKLFGAVIHPHERRRVNSATWFTTALFTLALFSSPVPALLAVLALSVGDPAAAFVGRRWGRIRLVAGRSLEGTATFAGITLLVCTGALVLFHGALGLSLVFALAACAGVIGALTELLSGRIDDNLSIPLAVAAATTGVLALAGV